jgi:hypothetical protein
VQTTAEKWTTQDYRCAQKVGAKFGTLAERMPLYRSDPFQKARTLPPENAKHGHRMDDDQTKAPALPPVTISSDWTRER